MEDVGVGCDTESFSEWNPGDLTYRSIGIRDSINPKIQQTVSIINHPLFEEPRLYPHQYSKFRKRSNLTSYNQLRMNKNSH